MKKFLFLLFMFCLYAGGAQVLRLEVQGNYLVVTDTTTSTSYISDVALTDVTYSVNSVNDEIQVLNNVTRSPRRIIPKQGSNERWWDYSDGSLVDANNAAFNRASLLSFFRNNTGGGISTSSAWSGWIEIADGTYTSGNPFTVPQGEQVTLPNDGSLRYIDSQKPVDVDSLYSIGDSTIIGRNGDGINVVLEFTAVPLNNNGNVELTVSVDIGGAIGEIRRRSVRLTRGVGVPQSYLTTTSYYTLDTWEANGGKIKLEARNSSINIYDIAVQIHRTHKAR